MSHDSGPHMNSELLKQWTLTANMQMLSQTSFKLCVRERERSSNFGKTRLSNPEKESGGAGRSQDACHHTGRAALAPSGCRKEAVAVSGAGEGPVPSCPR